MKAAVPVVYSSGESAMFPKYNRDTSPPCNNVSNQDYAKVLYNEYNSEVTLSQRNYFKKGDVVEIFGPSIEPFTFTIPDIYDEEGNILEVANHPEQIIKFKIPKKVYQYDIMRIKL